MRLKRRKKILRKFVTCEITWPYGAYPEPLCVKANQKCLSFPPPDSGLDISGDEWTVERSKQKSRPIPILEIYASGSKKGENT